MTLAVFRLIRPMIAWLVTDLPEPDSPTMASVLFLSTWKDTPSTAPTMPSSVGNWTARSSTLRNGSLYASSPTSPGDR